MGRTGRGVLCDLTRGAETAQHARREQLESESHTACPHSLSCTYSGLVFPKLLLRIKLVVDVDDLGYFSEDSGFLASLSGLRVSLAACPPCFTRMPVP